MDRGLLRWGKDNNRQTNNHRVAEELTDTQTNRQIDRKADK